MARLITRWQKIKLMAAAFPSMHGIGGHVIKDGEDGGQYLISGSGIGMVAPAHFPR